MMWTTKNFWFYLHYFFQSGVMHNSNSWCRSSRSAFSQERLLGICGEIRCTSSNSTGTLLQVVEQLRGSLLCFVKLCSSSFSSSHGGIHRWDVFQGDATFQGQVDPPSCAVKQCMFCDGEKACVCVGGGGAWVEQRHTLYLLGGAGLQVRGWNLGLLIYAL